MRTPRVILLTGGTGYLGGLAVASLLISDDDVRLVVPVRSHYDREGFWAPVRAEVLARTGVCPVSMEARVEVVELPALDALDRLLPLVEDRGVTEIIHCAGCLDYFDTKMLEAVNIGFTRDLLDIGSRVGVDRFVYVSTAFSSGLLDEEVPETLHRADGSDPTEYTRTKREAEWLVAESGLPHLILRPPIVIGDSSDGRYGGKRYGLYQLWSGMERLLFDEWHPEVHVVAPPLPLPMLHQDAFQDALIAALELLPDGSIFNMVPPKCPEARDLAHLWFSECMFPERAYVYNRLEDVPLLDINRRQRAFLGVASTNIQISSHNWHFDTPNADYLRARGADWVDTTVETVAVCQTRFKRSSTKIMGHLASIGSRVGTPVEVIETCLPIDAI